MNRACFACMIFSTLLITCVPKKTTGPFISNREMIFQSGFEGNVKVVPRNNDSDIIGTDSSVAAPNDWIRDLDNHPNIGNFNIQYEGGDSTMRYARIIPEPKNPKNHVLHFWLNNANVHDTKGRIQGNLYGNTGIKEFYQSVRVFLPDDFNAVKEYPREIHWLTIAEFWNNITWSQNIPYRFRITLGIGKPVPGKSDLFFILDAEDCELFADGKQKYTTVWAESNKTIKVPIGSWFTMDLYYKEGNDETGRFFMSIKPEKAQKKTVFNLKKITHNTQDPNPDGISDFNPMKLYTSGDLIRYMAGRQKSLQIYWDDFKLWKDKKPN